MSVKFEGLTPTWAECPNCGGNDSSCKRCEGTGLLTHDLTKPHRLKDLKDEWWLNESTRLITRWNKASVLFDDEVMQILSQFEDLLIAYRDNLIIENVWNDQCSILAHVEEDFLQTFYEAIEQRYRAIFDVDRYYKECKEERLKRRLVEAEAEEAITVGQSQS